MLVASSNEKEYAPGHEFLKASKFWSVTQEPLPVQVWHSAMLRVAGRPHWLRHSVVAPAPSLSSLSAGGQLLFRLDAKAIAPQLLVLLGLVLAPACGSRCCDQATWHWERVMAYDGMRMMTPGCVKNLQSLRRLRDSVI